jgi:surfactin synthase thioesterase subunit
MSDACRASAEAARCRLFCFPHAGGNSSAFRGWIDQPALAGVTVHAVDFPGRQARFREPALTRMDALVALLADELGPWFDRPFALFGHSMGALVAFELARALRRRGLPAPRHLFVSGHAGPHARRFGVPLHQLSDAMLLSRLGLAPHAWQTRAQHHELMALMLPTLRADVELCETHRPAVEPPLKLPLAAFGGTRDPGVRWSDLATWRAQTSAAFLAQQFPGDHHYLAQSPTELCAVVGRLLAAHAPRDPFRQETFDEPQHVR